MYSITFKLKVKVNFMTSQVAHTAGAYPSFRSMKQLGQGCALRKLKRSPNSPNYEIQGAQHKGYMKEIRLSGLPRATVSRLRHPGALRAQPCRSISIPPEWNSSQSLGLAAAVNLPVPIYTPGWREAL